MSDEELAQFIVPDHLVFKGRAVVEAALREAGYHPAPHVSLRRVANDAAPLDVLLRASNIARRFIGVPEFPDLETFKAYRAYGNRIGLQ